MSFLKTSVWAAFLLFFFYVALILSLLTAFEGAHGTHVCRELLDGCDLSTPEGQERFHASGLPVRVCQPCVRTVVSTVERLL